MKNRLKHLYKTFAASFLIASSVIGMYAATPADTSTRLAELDDMTFVEMLNSVHFDNKDASDLVQKFQAKEGQTRLRNGKYTSSSTCNVEACRNKEVLVITIPADILFAPNDTELKVGANEYLQPIKRYLRTPDMYRVLLVMHTDNTGSEQYRDELTQSRVDAVFDWFDDSEADTRYLFPYAFGDEMPIVQNTSMDNRAKNRRLEIYLVPGQKMLEQAKKGRIAF